MHVFHTTSSFLRSITSLASLFLISWLGIGCTEYTKKVVPDLSLSANSVDFQTVAVGQKATKTIDISNTGTAPLQISALSVSDKAFSITGPSVPRSLPAASSVTYTLTFAPTSAGNTSASVDIFTNVAPEPASISLAGSGKAAITNLVVNPTTINFGNIALKSTGTQNVTLENTGDSNLSLQGVTVSGAGFGYADLPPGFSLAPNQKVTFQVWFTPKAVGVASATLSLLSPDLSSPATLSLSGDGVSASTPPTTTKTSLVVSPTVINFGNITLKSTGTQNVTLENTGDSNLSLQGVTVSGAGFGYADLPPGFSLAPNQKVTFQVWFTPKAVGVASATLSLLSPDFSSPATLSLSGDGVSASTPPTTTKTSLVVSPTVINFGNITLKSTGTQNVTLENTGDSNLSLQGVTVSGAGFGYADLPPGFSLAPNQKVTFQVWFTPKAVGVASATLSLLSPDFSSPATLSLSGDGVSASTPPTTTKTSLVVSPTVISFGNITLKSTGTQNVTLENTGDSNLSLQGVTVSGAGFGYADLSPGFSLAPNQKVTFQVWFTPKVVGVASATLSLLSPDLSSPGTLSLSGDGVSASTPPTTNPPPPSTPPTVGLNWNASSSQVIGYRVYRSESSGSSYNLLTGTALTALTYTDTTVSSGTTYYYVVTAVNSAGVESVYSNQVTAAVPAS